MPVRGTLGPETVSTVSRGFSAFTVILGPERKVPGPPVECKPVGVPTVGCTMATKDLADFTEHRDTDPTGGTATGAEGFSVVALPFGAGSGRVMCSGRSRCHVFRSF